MTSVRDTGGKVIDSGGMEFPCSIHATVHYDALLCFLHLVNQFRWVGGPLGRLICVSHGRYNDDEISRGEL